MDDPKKIAESVRSGQYFKEARGWYQAVYVAPIASRTMFLLIAVLAFLVALFSILSMTSMLPLSKRVPVLIALEDPLNERVPVPLPLNAQKGDVNEALLAFLVQQFVVSAESWKLADAPGDDAFVKSHATEAVYHGYVQRMGPQGVGGTLAAEGVRTIEIGAVNIAAGQATIRFEAQVEGSNALPQKSQWTAKLKYTYTSLQVEEVKGEASLSVTDPQFQVTDYAVENR